MSKIRVVHYINQFFAGVGGEEQAHIAPELRTELPPISVQLQGQLGEEFEVVATVVCGDSYFNENLEKVQKELLEMIKGCEPQLFIAGPAFNAGRYGVAAGTITKAVQDELGIPAVTAMYVENPGTDMFRKEVYILETADSAAGMRKALPKLAKFAAKLAKGEEILSPKEEGYHERGIRVNFFSDKRGSERAVEMLVKKIKGEEFETEYPMPNFDRVEPNPVYANEDADRVLPVDVMREFVKEGKVGSLHEKFYTTVGNGTAVASAVGFAKEYAQKLVADGVDAVILTST